MQATTEWPEKLNPRCWQRFVTENATAYVACLGHDKGMEQVMTVIYPKDPNKPGGWFMCLTDNREHDIPETVERLIREGKCA